VWIATPYFIPDESLAKALELAIHRGVDVKVLLPRKSNHPLADFARGSFVRQLHGAGGEFYFYPRMIHAKAVLFDHSMALVGSANFDMRSLLLNYELGVLIYDESTLRKVSHWMSSCLSQSGRALAKETFISDLIEGVGRVIGPII
jgi:cardiolipin synthase